MFQPAPNFPGKCPNCGYCSHCGRSNSTPMPYGGNAYGVMPATGTVKFTKLDKTDKAFMDDLKRLLGDEGEEG